MNIRKILGLGILLLLLSSCGQQESKTDEVNFNWVTEKAFFEARSGDVWDNIAVKDPSIVKYNGKYHLFYTAKSADTINGKVNYKIGTGYASAKTLEGLYLSERNFIDSIVGGNVVAPQVFYFEPQKMWYLVAHEWVEGSHSNLAPIYMTNPDIENVNGWSAPEIISTTKQRDEFWIDFWMIQDGNNMFMFYSNQQGSIIYRKCPVAEFPDGLDKADEIVALSQKGSDEGIKWKMFEAAHIYYAKKEGKFISILEGAWPHPIIKHDVDARSRFIFAMTADSLDGEWIRLESDVNTFLADEKNIYNAEGSENDNSLVSHPELIRSGYNQKLEIESIENMQMIYQSFNKTGIPDTYNYNELPWKLFLMRRK